MPVTPEAARELPLGDCLVVAEDAHRRRDLDAVLSMLRQRPGRTKLLLVSRLHALPAIDAALTWANFVGGDVVRPAPLHPLDEADEREPHRRGPGHAVVHEAQVDCQLGGQRPEHELGQGQALLVIRLGDPPPPLDQVAVHVADEGHGLAEPDGAELGRVGHQLQQA